jgi:hypothetical protein
LAKSIQYLKSPAHTAWNYSKKLSLLTNDFGASVAVFAMKTSQLPLENAAYFVPMGLWVVGRFVIHPHLELPELL